MHLAYTQKHDLRIVTSRLRLLSGGDRIVDSNERYPGYFLNFICPALNFVQPNANIISNEFGTISCDTCDVDYFMHIIWQITVYSKWLKAFL